MGRASGYIGFCSYRPCLTYAINSDASKWALCIREDGLKKVYISLYIFVRVIVLLHPGFLVLLVRTLALRMIIYNTLCHRSASLRHALDWL